MEKPRQDDTAPGVGDERVRAFYDRVGWVEDERGVAADTAMFGAARDGPILRSLEELRERRVLAAFTGVKAGAGLDLLEIGCGGNPGVFLGGLCASYTGVDFSSTGLERARGIMAQKRPALPARFDCADITSLPFPDASFDAAYSAHAIYHIPSAEGQARAFKEAMRVLRPGGVGVFVLANPRPLAFPARLALRLAADTPGLGPALDRMRPPPPLPYKPMPVSWMRRELERSADVTVSCYSMPSTWFTQRVREDGLVGRTLWRAIGAVERGHPGLGARLGNYVSLAARKRA